MVILPFVSNYTVNYSYYVDELGDINDDHNKKQPIFPFCRSWACSSHVLSSRRRVTRNKTFSQFSSLSFSLLSRRLVMLNKCL